MTLVPMYMLMNLATGPAALTTPGFHPLLKPPERDESNQKPRSAALWGTLISLGVMSSTLRLVAPVACVASILPKSTEVTLAWDPSSSSDVVAYRIYYGLECGVYQRVVDTGLETTARIGGLYPGNTYYFAATSLNASGLESEFSNEISYTVLLVPPETQNLQLICDPTRGLVLKGSGQLGASYLIMASQDLVDWAVTDMVHLGGSETFEVVTPIRTNWPACFFLMRPASWQGDTPAPALN